MKLPWIRYGNIAAEKAYNAQYHDYIRMYKQWFPNLTEEQLDEKIIHSAINFWFEDEDAGSGKVWNYFKDIW